MTHENLAVRLEDAVDPSPRNVLTPVGDIAAEQPVLVVLAAGRGTRFGASPKCIQSVRGRPLARHSIRAFQSVAPGPVVCLVHYQQEEVMSRLGHGLTYVHSENPAGGTAFAAFEALAVPGLEEADSLLVITMGDRVVPAAVFRRLLDRHGEGPREADLTLLSALYEPPRRHGKGRILRKADREVVGIIEQRDIDLIEDDQRRHGLDDVTEANCPLYVLRASTLRRNLRGLTNDNAQRQYYITDIVALITSSGGDVRTLTTRPGDAEYDVLCCDVTRPRDLALLEGMLALAAERERGTDLDQGVDAAAATVAANRPAGQTASIAAQLEELVAIAVKEGLGFLDDRPVGIGISGGRLRIAFMHPDMGRFFGPAWQMPTGAADAAGREQIVVLVQASDDGRIHLLPTDPQFRERTNWVSADNACMYPGREINDWYSFEDFGTRMAEDLLASLGYFTDDELEARVRNRLPLPPESLWVSRSMRRPFSLLGNAIASMRTLREGTLGTKVQTYLGPNGFRGLRVMIAGSIPRGGFSSSSAVTVAVKNAVNALYDLGISPDLLVHLACQAEYGTGVRAGSLDQATEQKGRTGQGAVISSNPRDNYRVLRECPVPADRYKVIFPYTIDRDREAWQWSGGAFASSSAQPQPTTGEMRKLTGKAAEVAAILTRLPLDTDFFLLIQDELMNDGELGLEARRKVCGILRQLPMRIGREALRARLAEHRAWYAEQLAAKEGIDSAAACEQTILLFDVLLAGWRDPLLRRGLPGGTVVEETGVPLRAIVAYLFGEVAKNAYLMHHPDMWIDMVTRSQGGDRGFDLDPAQLPGKDAMMSGVEREVGLQGPLLLAAWLERYGATPVDFNRGLDDDTLANPTPAPLRLLEGGSFFRGIALIDLAEAMLKRAFGNDAVAVRVNAAGQGDYFQVHIDTTRAEVAAVKDFLRGAFYRRFGLTPDPEFVEPHPGGGAVGIRLSRFDILPELTGKLR